LTAPVSHTKQHKNSHTGGEANATQFLLIGKRFVRDAWRRNTSVPNNRQFDRCNKSVTASRKCLDEGGVVGRVAEGFAHPLDCGIQASFEIDKGISIPQCGAKFLSAYDFPVALDKLEKDLIWLILEPEFNAVLSQLGGFQVELKHSETADGIVLRRHDQS
jgi:hypothetical protein